MTQDLNDVVTEEIVVKRHETPVVNKIGSKDFCEALIKEFSDSKTPWRSSKALAEKLNVDAVELDSYLRSSAAVTALQQIVISRPSKEEGVFLYAFFKKPEEPAANTKEVSDKLSRPLVIKEDHYALSSLHSAFLLVEAALQKYALRIHECNPEAFTHLVDSKQKLEAGIALYGARIKADMSKLPKL